MAVERHELLARFVVALGCWKWRRHVAVPSLAPGFAVLEHQHRSRRQLLNALEDREGRGRVAIAQEEVQRDRIDLGTLPERGQHWSHLGAEPDGPMAEGEVDQLDAHGIARENE